MPIERKDFPTITTPVGVAVWPKLNEPDTKWKDEGEFSVKLKLDGEDAENLISQIKEFHALAYKVECEDHRGKKAKPPKLKCADPSYKPAVDEDEEEIPGVYLFNCKRRASGEVKKGPRAGTKWTARVMLFDSKGQPIPKNVEIWGGSLLKCSITLEPWYTPSLGFGIKLGLQAVKVLELVQRGQRSAADFGFDAEEEGYTAAQDDLPFDEEDTGDQTDSSGPPQSDQDEF